LPIGDNRNRNNVVIHFLNLKGIFSFGTKEKMPIKGLEKGDGVPPSPKAMARQVGTEGKNRSSKRFSFFPKSNYQPLSETKLSKKARFYESRC
jgi:hypothetical protein